jgi:hypothetical protein
MKGLTIGIMMPKDFLTEQNYSLFGIAWMLLPLGVFAGYVFDMEKMGQR